MVLANPGFDFLPNTDGLLAAAVGFAFRLPGWNLGGQLLFTPLPGKGSAENTTAIADLLSKES